MSKNENELSVSFCAKGILFGSLVGLLVTLVIMFCESLVVAGGYVKIGSATLLTLIAVVLGAISAAICAVKRVKRRAIIVAIMSAGAMYLVTLLIGYLIEIGVGSEVGEVQTFLSAMGGAVIGAVIASSGKKKR